MRENKPRLTWDANTPYKWYKMYVHGLFNPRPAQAAAYPGRGVLGWTYPIRGLPWTWKRSNVVRGLLKPWTIAAHALFSIISQTFTAERRALQWRENEFCLHLHRGKWRIEIHVKNEMCGVPQKKNKSCSYAASLRLRGSSMSVYFKSTLIKSTTWPRTKPWTIYTSSSRLI